jgi:hypothetical protein
MGGGDFCVSPIGDEHETPRLLYSRIDQAQGGQMTDLRERAPAQAVMEKLVSLRCTPDLVKVPLGIVKLSKDGLSWLRGVNGELKMAKQLLALGDGWTVLHSVPVGTRGSDIDHVVVGPSGVFPINTKRLLDARVWVAGGRFLVNGRRRDYLRNSDYEATRVEAVLHKAAIPLNVVPVVAISGAKSIKIEAPGSWNDRGIGVVPIEDVVRRIRKRAPKISSAQVDRVVALFSDPAVWSRRALAGDNADAVRAGFDKINRGVSRWNAFVGASLLVALLIVCGGCWVATGMTWL